MGTDILWHHADEHRMVVWLMDGIEVKDAPGVVAGAPGVLGEPGETVKVGPPWRIVGVGDFARSGIGSDNILWHNFKTFETKIWFMNGHRLIGAENVLLKDDFGQFTASKVGGDWKIVGAGDFGRFGNADILWHNQRTFEIIIWFMDLHKVLKPETVLKNGVPFKVGPPFQIVGVGDFDRDGASDILWHRPDTGEVKIWFMGHLQVRREHEVRSEETVVDARPNATGAAFLLGPPWRIVGTGNFDTTGNVGILWHNDDTKETKVWFMQRHRVVAALNVRDRATGKNVEVGFPFRIAGAGKFHAGFS